ncbi:hypothetical protein DFJ74DRAFT_710755 [Hyaloraphidium curvatum]|nr:hypothetical protein DFJ74DRAFT_710755 [Hyaloraphidium curvatum]
MHAHHRSALERIVRRFQADPDALALIVVGSVARGDARPDSDVDAYLVVTDERFADGRREWNADDLCDWHGGTAGGPIVDLGFLRDAAERAPEPLRYAFTNAFVAFSRVPDLQELLDRIPVYQGRERAGKLAGFAGQLPVHLAYLRLGEYSRNAYLLAEPAVELVLYGGRLILAHNRMLYPGRKWFMRELARAPVKPEAMVRLAEELLAAPSIARAEAFCGAVLGFAAWPQPPEGATARFRRDREDHWRSGAPPLADC